MSEGKKEILLGDCLELMKDIPNGSIDMILADFNKNFEPQTLFGNEM